MTPEQYLAAVHNEARAMPHVLAAKLTTSPTAAPANPPTESKQTLIPSASRGVVPPPPHAIPNLHWCQRVAFDYAQIQTALASLSPPLVVSRKDLPQTAEQWRSHFVSNAPSMTFLKRLDFLAIARALAVLDDAIPFDATAALHTFCSSSLPLWAFCLLAFVQPYVFVWPSRNCNFSESPH